MFVFLRPAVEGCFYLLMRKIILLAALLLLAPALHAKLALRHPTGDHMVLQQNADAAVWGYASPGSTVTVTPSWDG